MTLSTVTVVFHSDGWSTKAEIVFAVIEEIFKFSSLRTAWDFAIVFAVSASDSPCQVRKVDEAMCSINYYTVVSHEVPSIDWSREFAPDDEVCCQRITSFVEFEGGLWLLLWVSLTDHLPLVFEHLEGRQFWRNLWGLIVWFCFVRFQRCRWQNLQSQLRHPLLGRFRNPEWLTASLFSD